jgi:hypothetical protein
MAVASKELSDRARFHYQAVNIAKNRIERLKVIDYDQLEHSSESYVRVDCAGTPKRNGKFRRTTMISDVNSSVRQVHVVVDILDRQDLRFAGEKEEMKSCLTRFRTSVQ